MNSYCIRSKSLFPPKQLCSIFLPKGCQKWRQCDVSTYSIFHLCTWLPNSLFSSLLQYLSLPKISLLFLISPHPVVFLPPRERRKVSLLMFWLMVAWCPSLLLPRSWTPGTSSGVSTQLWCSAAACWREPSPERRRSWAAGRRVTMRPRGRWWRTGCRISWSAPENFSKLLVARHSWRPAWRD